jgi:hypothetical protein
MNSSLTLEVVFVLVVLELLDVVFSEEEIDELEDVTRLSFLIVFTNCENTAMNTPRSITATNISAVLKERLP